MSFYVYFQCFLPACLTSMDPEIYKLSHSQLFTDAKSSPSPPFYFSEQINTTNINMHNTVCSVVLNDIKTCKHATEIFTVKGYSKRGN